MTVNLPKQAGNALSVRPLAPTWGGVLAIDDDPHTVQIPEGFVMKEGFVSKDGFWSQEASDAVARAQVTPEMLAQLDPSLRQMLARIGREVRDSEDPFKSWLMSRAATLLSYLGVPQTVVLNTFAEAAMQRFDFWANWSFDLLGHQTHLCLLDFRDDSVKNGKPAVPAFYNDEYGPMALYVLGKGLEALTAKSEREFFDGEQEIPLHVVNSVLQICLESCDILDSVRKVPVSVSNRLIAEVRCAIARKRPRWSTTPDNSQGDIRLTLIQRVAAFAGERLALDEKTWTSSDALWRAWLEWCATRSERPGENALFFKALVNWSSGRIYRVKKQTSHFRPPGYLGIMLLVVPD